MEKINSVGSHYCIILPTMRTVLALFTSLPVRLASRADHKSHDIIASDGCLLLLGFKLITQPPFPCESQRKLFTAAAREANTEWSGRVVKWNLTGQWDQLRCHLVHSLDSTVGLPNSLRGFYWLHRQSWIREQPMFESSPQVARMGDNGGVLK